MRKRVFRIVRRARRDGRALWRFFRHGETKRDRLRRARSIVFVAETRQRRSARRANIANYALTHNEDLTHKQKERWRRRRKNAWEAFEKWQKFRFAYNRKAKRLQQAIADGQVQPGDGFELWQLNGHSSNISDGTKRLVAYVVGVKGGVVTDTYDFPGHTSSSFHYPRNNPDGKCHAIDWVPASCTLQTQTKDHFAAKFFKELFGPCHWYVKFSQIVQSGAPFPGHDDHEHGSPYS